jgi:transposase
LSIENKKILKRLHIAELPLIKSICEKIGLRDILSEYLPKKKNEDLCPVDTLMLLVYNLANGKNPLYELEEWARSIDKRCIGYEKYEDAKFTDDRFGRALDRLYKIDRATLMTKIVVEMINKFKVDLNEIHNDSTSVSAYGEYPEKTSTGFELKKGRSKDHKPGLKQLIYSLSISADGAVPIHYKAYPGNRNDDDTHIETWNTLAAISLKPDFLYVADCKLCSDSQLSHIAGGGGRAITPIPECWKEVAAFKSSQRAKPTTKTEIWRRYNEATDQIDYFSAYDGEYLTNGRGYKIHWIHSSARRQDDYDDRQERLKKAEDELRSLSKSLNRRQLKSEYAIRNACQNILKNRKVERFFEINITQTKESRSVKCGRGRPGKNATYRTVEEIVFAVSWSKKKDEIEAEKNVDGIYPLLSTDPNLSAKEVLQAFKYQPKLEKRFTQLKSVHNIAPLLFKKLERVEANLFLFFIALMIQALIEREVRFKMKNCGLPFLQVYPERRDAAHPTTSKIFDIFSEVSTYKISNGITVLEEYADELNHVQKTILNFLSISEETYWSGINKRAV